MLAEHRRLSRRGLVADPVEVPGPLETPCLIWQGSLTTRGYGQRNVGGRPRGVHVWAWTLVHGPVPDGLVLDHLCDVKSCLAPDHLKPTTSSANVDRSPRSERSKTHCPQGHPYAGANLLVRRNGNRRCATCHRTRERARKRSARR